MYCLHNTTSDTLYSVINDIIIRFYLNKENIRGQSYDGAANMAGHINGVAQRILQDVPQAVFVHCYAHRINLVLQDVCKQVRLMNDAQDLVKEIYNYINLAPR